MNNVPVSAQDLVIRLGTMARGLERDRTEVDLHAMINGVRFPLTRGNFQVDDDGTLLFDLVTGLPAAGVPAMFVGMLLDKLLWYRGCDFVRMGDVETAIVEAASATGQPGTLAAYHLVLLERLRQIYEEGFSLEHDDEHHQGELAIAAACYAEEAFCQLRDPDRLPEISQIVPQLWPWEPSWWKPSLDARRNLVKAGALILAAIGVVDRAIETELKEPNHG
ncbi:hypothetical protein [Pseudomonas citronellolis]|uniref:hypothetical protein n=1 Tax=Pseudomonas citronellolis TaxID=53408 RepID=UPI0023E42458|nr:hypothetical protein [Pseudomonas citronellolis]MDF3932969.1 hypothetical protein [Pseudomonas citronellolis]